MRSTPARYAPRVRESDLLRHIQTRSTLGEGVLVGPGDDCAVVVGTSHQLLKVDQLVEHRHYRAGTPIDLIARKALARPLSDIAAMAGRPRYALAAATLPAGYPHARELFDAVHGWGERFGCPVVGGDIATHDGPLILSISIIGVAHAARGPVLRRGAKSGDDLFVTGSLGGSFDAATGLGRHLTFTPRLDEAVHLADSLVHDLHAMMDLSDGLGIDAGRLAESSGVRVIIERGRIPLSPGITDPSRALQDGEDYELLFTAPPGALPDSGVLPTGCPFARIGRTEIGAGATDETGQDIAAIGWDHR